MPNRWTRIALFAAGSAFLGSVLSVEVYFSARAGSHPWTVNFAEVAIPQYGRAIMWALLAPFILEMRRKLPLNRGHWAGGIGFHLAMSFVVMAVFYVGRIVGYILFFHEFMGFWRDILLDFSGHNMVDMVYYWAVLGFGYGWELHQRYKSEELRVAQLESRLIETELKALREQLHPHFLFNALNTVSVLVREQKNDDAVTLIARLSSLLRMTLDSARTQEVTLRQEMDLLERYIEIQKVRFSDRLSVEVAIEPAAMDARIPNLLLQPLVENAILHGIAPKRGPGRVKIGGFVKAQRLYLEVSDDGVGLNRDTPPREGVGLSNARERIAKIYGAAGHLSLRSELGRGVTMHIAIPFRT